MYGETSLALAKLTNATFPFLTKVVTGDSMPPTGTEANVLLADGQGRRDDLVAVGDKRANENSLLLSNHIMFSRLHDIQVRKAAVRAGFCSVGWDRTVACAQKIKTQATFEQKAAFFNEAHTVTIGIGQKTAEEFAHTIMGNSYKPPGHTTLEAHNAKVKPLVGDSLHQELEIHMFPEFSHATQRFSHAQIRNDIALTRSAGASGAITTELIPLWYVTASVHTRARASAGVYD